MFRVEFVNYQEPVKMSDVSIKSEGKYDGQDATVEAFLHLYATCHYRILAYILSLVPNETDAEDLMQETTMVMWRKFKQFEMGTDFVAWGMAIARYEVLDARKRQKSMMFFDDEVLQALEADSLYMIKQSDSSLDILKACLDKLCKNDQQLIYLRYFEDHSIKNISSRTGRNLKTVYRTIARIHDNLLECLRRQLQKGDLYE